MLRIYEARESMGMTQEQLAVEMKTTQATIQRWESGQVEPKTGKILELSKILNVTVSFLMGVDEVRKPLGLSPAEQELVDIMRTVTPEGQRQLMVFARGIAATYSKSNQVAKVG